MSVLENFNKINECNHNPSIRSNTASHGTVSLELNASFLSKFLKNLYIAWSGAFARVRNYTEILNFCKYIAKTRYIEWWRLTGSNRWPHACKARALPTELSPHLSNLLQRSDKCEHQVNFECFNASLCKGGDPAAPSGTATLLRLHPSHETHRGRRPPYG